MKKIIILSLLAVFVTTGCKIEKKDAAKTVSIEEAKTITADFVNNNLMQPGNQVTIKAVTEEGGMYKVVVAMTNGQEINSYLSKDGKKFFPQVMDIEETKKETAAKAGGDNAAEAEKTAANVKKTAKPKVELFVMSHCPFGTQIEKGILPVVEALGDKMDFSLKFCDYAMHGEKELKEEMTQYCIQKEEPKKLMNYLKCFLGTKSGDATESEACLKSTGINANKNKTCVAATDTKYKVSANFKDKSTYKGSFATFDIFKEDNAKYGVGGSPTLVINGEKISSGRDAKTLLSTICAGFEKQPDACKKELSAASPSAGFGFGESGGDAAAASCGN